MNNGWWYKMNEKNEQRENVRTARRQQQKKESRIRMLKVGSAVAVVLLLVGAVTGLYLHNKNDTSAKSTTISTSKTAKKKESASTETSKTKETMKSTQSSAEGALEEQLQTILTTYSKKIEDQTPVLIEEYQTEIQKNQDGLTGLSTVANQKASELQAISDEGIRKLREKYQTAHAKDGVDLDTMINQLSATYTAQVARISDIYLRTSASLKVESSTSQETSGTETNTTAQTTESTTESQMSTDQYAQGTSSSQSADQSASAATTVVREGEGPNQIAERTGVPVETILSLNGMTMDDYFLNPGEVLKLN